MNTRPPERPDAGMTPAEKKALSRCMLCRRRCGIDRLSGGAGFCGAGAYVKAARAALHFGEEPCLCGTGGSGAVFFSHCSLQCAFCQNYEVSHGGIGLGLDRRSLADIFLSLEKQGAENIDLVTPTHYIPQILPALRLAREEGLTLPTVWNVGGYESEEALALLNGYADIYLPDFKYFGEGPAKKYSRAPGYFAAACAALDEMVRQAGPPVFRADGTMARGVIVRHLMLPGLLFDTKKVLDYLWGRYGDTIFISLMSQYTPAGEIGAFPELQRTLPPRQYAEMLDYAAGLGIENCYVQDTAAAGEEFVPLFDGTGVKEFSPFVEEAQKML